MSVIASTESAPTAAGPVKIVIERRIHPGADVAFSRWVERFVSAARARHGHEGASVLTSHEGVSFILLRFASTADLDAWQRSAEYASFLKEANSTSDEADAPQVRSGLETWFTLPDMPAPAAPPAKWKMALLTWLCLLPLVVALAYAFAPLRLPFAVEVTLSTVIPVALLTWSIMPLATRTFYSWLYPKQARASTSSVSARSSM